MNLKKISALAVGLIVSCFFTSCTMMEPDEVPIRPTSDNSDIAHGSSSPSGEGALGGLGQGFGR